MNLLLLNAVNLVCLSGNRKKETGHEEKNKTKNTTNCPQKHAEKHLMDLLGSH